MKISYGNSRFETKWKNSEITWEDFKKRVSSTIRTTETIEEYRKMTKAQQANVKDKGGFVAGHLKGGRRKKNTVLCRSALALDMDYGTPGVWDDIIAKQPYLWHGMVEFVTVYGKDDIRFTMKDGTEIRV